MHFGRKNNRTEYYMNGQKLESITEEKDLGIIISQDSLCIQQQGKQNAWINQQKHFVQIKGHNGTSI